jgi:hypothetical protein
MTSAARKPSAGAGKKAAKKAAPKKSAPKAATRKAPAKAAPTVRHPDPHVAEEAHRAEAMRKIEAAEHEHQDPRGTAARFDRHSREHKDPRKVQDSIKSRGIPRLNPIVNWFRRAPKRPGN